MNLFCKNCKQIKRKEDFYFHAYKKKNGEITLHRSYLCKYCISMIRKLKYNSNEQYRLQRLKSNENWRKKNRKKHLENRRKWRLGNKERIREYQREFYRVNREKILAQQKERYQKNKDYYYRKRREWYSNQRKKLVNLLGGKCVVCGETEEDFLEFDHIKPVRGKREGNSIMQVKKHPERFQLLCANCHRRKTSNERKV